MNVSPPGPFGQPTPGSGGPWGPPQQGWQQAPPPKRGAAKWIFGAIALLAVVAVTVVVTVMVTGKDSGGDSGDPSAPQSDIASANDKGPVTIITEEPTCTKWTETATQLSDRTGNGWDKRDASTPAASWTPVQRRQFEEVGEAMRRTADESVALARQTPHRVVREMYEQFIAYGRAYADSIQTYTQDDEPLARVAVNATSVLTAICTSIYFGSAGSVATTVSPSSAPAEVAAPQNLDAPSRFAEAADPICAEIQGIVTSFDDQTTEWRAVDPALRASALTADEARIYSDAAITFSSFSNIFADLSSKAESPTASDFALLVSQCMRAFANAIPTYTSADSYISKVATSAGAMLNQACQAAPN